MKSVLLTALLLAIAFLGAQEFRLSTPGGDVSVSISGVQESGNTTSGIIIDQIAAKLEILEKDIHGKLSKLDQKKAENILNEIYGLLALLPSNQTINLSSSLTARPTPVKPETPAAPPVVQPAPAPAPAPAPVQTSRKSMSDKDFTALMDRIKAESFGDNKLRVLRTAALHSRFNCAQIVRLIGAFTYSDEKLEALRVSYPDCTDPQNSFRIIDAFTYSDDKEEAERIINK